MKISSDQYKNSTHKNITLMGMSGVGKTYLSNILRKDNWFHYSGDYRVGTRYLDEIILDVIKQQAMSVPFLKNLLRKDWISIKNNIKIDDLGPVLSFIGKLGDPYKNGVALADFIKRQAMYREAEIQAMADVSSFIKKSQKIYGYNNFINDAGGSLCELDHPGLIDDLNKNTLIIYIKTTNKEEEQALINRALSAPKPLYYPPKFLKKYLKKYLQEKDLPFAALIDPDEFTKWIFPILFKSRLPKYDSIAKKYGISVTSAEISQIKNENDFNRLIIKTLQNANNSS
ncbi:MAG: ATPase [Gammaproteobacteria bacterium]|nr:MAG: ATPase [Gammaproteobacteria bacterium]